MKTRTSYAIIATTEVSPDRSEEEIVWSSFDLPTGDLEAFVGLVAEQHPLAAHFVVRRYSGKILPNISRKSVTLADFARTGGALERIS